MQSKKLAFILCVILIGCATVPPRKQIIYNSQIALYGDNGETFCSDSRMETDPQQPGWCTLKETFVPHLCKKEREPIRIGDQEYCEKIRAGFPECPSGGPYTKDCAKHPLDPGI